MGQVCQLELRRRWLQLYADCDFCTCIQWRRRRMGQVCQLELRRRWLQLYADCSFCTCIQWRRRRMGQVCQLDLIVFLFRRFW
jgi:hypothetical protein